MKFQNEFDEPDIYKNPENYVEILRRMIRRTADFWGGGAKASQILSQSFRSGKMLENEALIEKFGIDATENGPWVTYITPLPAPVK